ncbi:hypothetical protein [Sphingobacterium multivorum]|uniref:hypothetical protein n=1 Tax=Sphingobacterium multivorum TaxID=28454 RepID=UPI00345E1044
MICNNIFFFSLITSLLLISCNHQTPQEKASHHMEEAEHKAAAASEQAIVRAEAAAAKNTEAVIYANIAAANEAVAGIPAPALSNKEAERIYNKLGKIIVDRINAKTAVEAMEKEQAIARIKKDILENLRNGKITQADHDGIMGYLEDSIKAAKSVM